MKRKGNEILFDNQIQKLEFEETMSSSNPQFIRDLLAIISSFHRERGRVWHQIIKELKANGWLSDNETLTYNWMQRKLFVEEMANDQKNDHTKDGVDMVDHIE